MANSYYKHSSRSVLPKQWCSKGHFDRDALNLIGHYEFRNFHERRLCSHKDTIKVISQNELSSPIAANFCPTFFFGLDFHFYVIFFYLLVYVN